MNRVLHTRTVLSAVAFALVAGIGLGQSEQHGRKWKPLPEEAHIVVTVQKATNGKPIENAGVVFHAVRDGKNDGNLEVKTDPDGRATLDLIEVGSQVSVQVIANGFATAAQDIDVNTANKELLFKMQRPREQVSEYRDNDGKAAIVHPGIQEHVPGKPVPVIDPTKVAAPSGAPNGPAK